MSLDWEYKRGAAEFRCGRLPPPRVYDEDGRELPHDDMMFARWAGYMIARGKVIMARKKIEDALRPDPNEPRPPMALAA